MTKYKCPNCGAIDKYHWLGEDDNCLCEACNNGFNASDCEVKEELEEVKSLPKGFEEVKEFSTLIKEDEE